MLSGTEFLEEFNDTTDNINECTIDIRENDLNISADIKTKSKHFNRDIVHTVEVKFPVQPEVEQLSVPLCLFTDNEDKTYDLQMSPHALSSKKRTKSNGKQFRLRYSGYNSITKELKYIWNEVFIFGTNAESHNDGIIQRYNELLFFIKGIHYTQREKNEIKASLLETERIPKNEVVFGAFVCRKELREKIKKKIGGPYYTHKLTEFSITEMKPKTLQNEGGRVELTLSLGFKKPLSLAMRKVFEGKGCGPRDHKKQDWQTLIEYVMIEYDKIILNIPPCKNKTEKYVLCLSYTENNIIYKSNLVNFKYNLPKENAMRDLRESMIETTSIYDCIEDISMNIINPEQPSNNDEIAENRKYFEAARNNDLAKFQTELMSLSKDLLPFIIDRNTFTLLHAICYYNEANMIKNLINIGLSLNDQDQNGRTPLHIAIERQNVECIEVIRKLINDARMPIQRNKEKNEEMMKLFNIYDDNGLTVMHAAIQADLLKLVDTMLEFCLNKRINACTIDVMGTGDTILHLAKSQEIYDVIKMRYPNAWQYRNYALQTVSGEFEDDDDSDDDDSGEETSASISVRHPNLLPTISRVRS